MPRTNIARVQAARAGATVPAATAADVANGNQVDWDDYTTLLVTNTNGAATARNITFTPIKKVDGTVGAARVVSIPAGGVRLFGRYDFTDYGSPLQIDGAHAEVTILALRA